MVYKKKKSRSKRKRRKSIRRKSRKSKRKKRKTGGSEGVPQRKHFDCALATLSMMTEVPYHILKERHFKDHDFDKEGVRGHKEAKILKKEGYDVKFFKNLPKGKKAIVTVPSLNYKKSYHDVFWDGSKIYDPNIGNQRRDSKIKLYKSQDVINGKIKLVEILGFAP